MTDEKKHVDLSTIEPIVHGADPEEVDPRGGREDVDRVRTVAAAPVGSPLAGVLPETDDAPPPDPDDLDRLRRG